MKEYLNQKVLLSTSNWFYAPDGLKYRACWGTLKAVHHAKEAFGFEPNRSHANWIVEVGNMLIMGCQVLYCIHCPEKPNTNKIVDVSYGQGDGAYREFERPTEIYICE